MILTPSQIVANAQSALTAAQSLYSLIEKGMAALNAHNGTKDAPHVNAGPQSVALGNAQTIIDQLQKHIAENEPVAQPIAASPQDTPPPPPGAVKTDAAKEIDALRSTTGAQSAAAAAKP